MERRPKCEVASEEKARIVEEALTPGERLRRCQPLAAVLAICLASLPAANADRVVAFHTIMFAFLLSPLPFAPDQAVRR
jgi:hypothetical protein